MEIGNTFDPRRYLIKLSGKEYLEVKWRVYWLRSQHPNAIISTEMIKQVFASPDGTIPAEAIFKAYVAIPEGGEATGWGSESEADFHDYIEKAETKALGRALAALGFGVQFAGDDFEGVERFTPQGNRKQVIGGKKDKLATDQQFVNINAWREAQELTKEQMHEIMSNVVGHAEIDTMTEQEAGKILFNLNRVALVDLIEGRNIK
jgi:hypothetical protein